MGNTVYKEYSKIIEESEKWFRFNDRSFDEQLNIDTLFESINSNNFIKLMFFHENLIDLISKVKFPEKREYHTVSAFLLGILFKDKLKLSTRRLPNPCKDYKKSFIYFWSMICLSHDLTFWLESNKEYIKKCGTVEEFSDEFNIKYHLVDASKYGQLFKDYYRYKVEKRQSIDHGITCGIIIYDQLMKRYSQGTDKSIVITRDQWKYTKNFKEYALTISETIARHNLWVAESKEDEETYKEYNLHQLIGSEPFFKKVNYSEQDSMLFLLGLVDTLEPIKCCTRNKNKFDVYDILKNIKIDCNDRKKSISFCSETYLNNKVTNSWKGLNQWLNVNLDIGNYEVKISFEYESEESDQVAA